MKEFGIAHFLEQCNANLDKYWRHSTFTAFTGICSQVSHKTTESYLLWFVLFFRAVSSFRVVTKSCKMK